MNIIFKEILYQKLKSKPNRKFIRRLQNYVDKTDEMTLKDFQSFEGLYQEKDLCQTYTMPMRLKMLFEMTAQM